MFWAYEVDFELKNDRGGVPADLPDPLFVLERADVRLALLLIGYVEAGVWIIEEKSHAQQQPRCQEPHDREDDEGLHLVPALAVHLVDQMLSRRQLQHVAFL